MGIIAITDEQLVVRCLAGDGAAFAEMHTRYAPRVAAYFLRSGFEGNLAQDLTQDVFLRAYQSLRTFDSSRGALGTWIGAIARNVARGKWRGRKGEGLFDDEMAQEALADTSDAGPALEDREEIEALVGCLEHLDKELGRLIRLRYVDSLTTRGMAEATGLAESTVRVRLEEARAKLEMCLKGRGFMK